MKKIQQTVHEKIKSIVSALWEFCASISDMTIDSGIQLKVLVVLMLTSETETMNGPLLLQRSI